MQKQSKTKKITYGKAQFKDTFNKMLIKTKQIMAILKKERWDIDVEAYQRYNWKQVFKHMIACSAEKVWFRYNNYLHIVKEIQDVAFTNMKTILLYQNSINNIQALTFLNCQNLQWLALSGNQISRIICFKKLYLPFLDRISLDSNPILELNPLGKSKIHDEQFKELSLQSPQILAIPINQDLSFVVRLSCQSFEKIKVQSQTRIKQLKIQSMLANKFPQIQVQGIRRP